MTAHHRIIVRNALMGIISMQVHADHSVLWELSLISSNVLPVLSHVLHAQVVHILVPAVKMGLFS